MPLTIQDEQDRLALLMKETPLLWAGHISLSADGGKSIYGFQCPNPNLNPNPSPHPIITR